MDFLTNYLENYESIQWKRIRPKNLLRYVYYIFLIEILLSLLILTLILFPPFTFINIFETIIYYAFFIFIELFLLVSLNRLILKERSKRLNALTTDIRDLKNYSDIDIITNKRIIQKNYRNISTLQKSYPDLFDTISKIENDVISFKLDKIRKILFKTNNKRIIFIINDYQEINSIYLDFWKFKFKESDLQNMYNVMEILKNLITLTKIEESPHEIIYQRGN